jgi:uncharacterized protein (DUF885 family)
MQSPQPVFSRRALLASSVGATVTALLPETAFSKLSGTGLLDHALKSILKKTPESCVYAGLSATQIGAPVLNRLDDYSPAGEEANRRALRTALGVARLAGKSNAAKVAQAVYRNALLASDIPYGRIYPLSYVGHTPFVVSQIGGATIDPFNIMAAQQPATDDAEAKAYVEKLADVPRALAGAAAKIRSDAALGLVLPQALMTKTLAQLDAVLKTPAASHELVTTFGIKLKTANMAEASISSHQNAATEAVQKNVYAALATVRDTLKEIASKSRAEDGIWSQPQGEEFYGHAIKSLGDSMLTAAQIHDLGLAEVARITGDMDAGLRKLGYTDGPVGQRMKALGAEAKQMYADTDAGRAQLLDDLRAQVAAVNKKMPQFLNKKTIPPQQVEVRRVPLATEGSAPGGYYDSPSLDGKRPGIYWINLRDINAVSKVGLATLTFHEAVPGHHLANAVALNQPSQPLVQKLASFNAFNEGWALYAERLAFELGFYEKDPVGNLGRLQAELFRAVRLVVDSGLHHKRWSRAQAIQYAMDTTGNVRSRMEAEIERYMAWPGQALGYKLGMIELLNMREKLKKRLGKKFSLRNFHDAVLINGSRPISLVAADIAILK